MLMLRIAQAITRERRVVTAREMELWVHHMRDGATEENLLAWCEAAKTEGLHPDGYADAMVEFIHRGIATKSKPH
jgi:hypothetical protein